MLIQCALENACWDWGNYVFYFFLDLRIQFFPYVWEFYSTICLNIHSIPFSFWNAHYSYIALSDESESHFRNFPFLLTLKSLSSSICVISRVLASISLILSCISSTLFPSWLFCLSNKTCILFFNWFWVHLTACLCFLAYPWGFSELQSWMLYYLSHIFQYLLVHFLETLTYFQSCLVTLVVHGN